MHRRAFALLTAASAAHLCLGCDRRSAPGSPSARPPDTPDDGPERAADAGPPPVDRWTSADFPDVAGEARNGPPFGRAMIRTPGEQPLPAALIALHGHAESLKGLEVGARAWKDNYFLDTAYARMSAPPLSSADAGGFLKDDQLEALNRSLGDRPFQGLALACPFTPDIVDPKSDLALAYGDFLVDRVLAKVRELAPGVEGRVGIDGISMGGRIALMVGLARPDVFRSVGCLQPFLKEEEAEAFAEVAARASPKQALQLVTAESDPSLDGVKALGRALADRGVEHTVVVAGGGHTYEWIQGAGALQMLYFHDRALRVG